MKKIIITLVLTFGFLASQANYESFSFDPDSLCTVSFDTIQNGACFVAVPTGTAPFTFFWSDSTTSNTACLNPNMPDLCVTVVDASGCVVTACTGNTPPNCTTTLQSYVDTVSSTAYLYGAPSGDTTQTLTYVWSTGETTPSITVTSTGNYCVTIVDASNCVSFDCAYIDIDNITPTCYVYLIPGSNCLEAVASGTAPFTYQWSNGQTTQTACSNSPGIDSICVTMTDANGCQSIACGVVNNSPTCSVYTVPVQGSNCLEAIPSGTGPFTFQWSNGEVNQIACSNNPNLDTLCVTITDANGCSSEYCSVVGNGINCFVDIQATAMGLMAVTNDSLQNYTYDWSNGENTPSISPSVGGIYCVTITTPGGCQATDCYSFTAQDEISGIIFLDSINSGNIGVNNYKIYLIQNDAVAGTLTAVDSQVVTTTPNNFGAEFLFGGVSAGDYLVKVALEPGSDQYNNFLPTYYGPSLFWNQATTVTSPGTNNNLYIDMIQGVNPGGPGFIGGLISEGANIVSGQAQVRGLGDPIENVSVLLLTDTDLPVAYAMTDANGEFEFPSVAYGTYQVIVEILGKDQGIKMITLSPDEPNVEIDFEVNEEYVTKIEDVLNGASLKLFPNPVTETLNIQVEIRQSVRLNISVINLLGETIISDTQQMNEGVQTMGINLSSLPQGIYFLNLSDGQEILSQKIMKQ